ncbi:hypothetical protein K502DRAFT_322598, partial [Neoconidiobolus thromboides FSU 785]
MVQIQINPNEPTQQILHNSELILLDLQGVIEHNIESSASNTSITVGDLTFSPTSNKVLLTIENYQLEGELIELKKKLAYISKKEDDKDYKLNGIINKKIRFNTRPTIITEV